MGLGGRDLSGLPKIVMDRQISHIAMQFYSQLAVSRLPVNKPTL